MIKKYNDFLNEKLSDKLQGKNENEILNFLKTLDKPYLMLDKAIKLRTLKGIDYALEQGANIENSHIQSLINDKEYEIAAYLIEQFGNIETNTTLFQMIINDNNKYLLQKLFDNGLKITFLNSYIVERLASSSNIGLMKIILDNQLDLNKYGEKMLAGVLLRSRINMLKLLIKYNINVNPKTLNPIEYACYDNKKYKTIIQLLLDNGLEKDKYINEALHSIIIRGYYEQTKYLVEIGADIHSFNDEDKIYVHKEKMLELVKELKEKNPE